MQGVETCFNPEWESGLSSSLSSGLHSITEGADPDGVLVMLADQSHLTGQMLMRLLAAFQEGHRLVAAQYDGVIGVPAVFGSEFFAELSRLTGDSGAGAWLRARSRDVRSIPLSDAAYDVDIPGDLPNPAAGSTPQHQ